MGTLDYMAPEQCDDSRQVDIRADIYSLGATLYKLLAGRAPLDEPGRDTPMKKMIALTGEPPTPIRTLRPEVPELLAQVIHRMLAKQPDQRFDTPARVAIALTPFAESADVPGWLAGALESDLADLRTDSLLTVDSAETLMSDSQKKTEVAFDPYHVWLSIAPAEQPPHHYRLLGLQPFESDLRVIESAADRQMAHVRTFQSGKSGKASQQLLNEISAAKLCLLNEAKKRAYDKKLQVRLAEAEQQSTSAARPAAAPTARPAAKPARKTTTSAAVQADAPRASQVDLAEPIPSVDIAAPHSKSPNWALIGSVAAAVAVLSLGTVVFLGMKDDDPPVTQGPTPPPALTEDVPSIAAIASKETDDTPKQPETPLPPGANQSIDDASKSPHGQASTSVEPGIEPKPITNPPAVKPIEEPVENPTRIEISQDDAVGPTESPATNPTTVSTDEPAESDKLPIPAGEEVKAAEQLARELFAEDIKNATTSEEESKLGARLLDTAAQSQGKPAERFVLMKMAYDLATDAGNLELIVQSVAALDRTFQVDPLLLRATSLAAASKARMSSSASRGLTEAMLDLMTDAESAERFGDIVAPLRTLTGTTARKTNETEFRKYVIKRLKQSNEREDQFDDASRAIEKLAADDTDAAAHEVLGKYLCFVKGDWTEGLPHLACGSDERLKRIAMDDLAAKDDPSAQIAAADAWYQLAQEAYTGNSQSQLLRAAYWYRKAIGHLSGLAKLEAEKRLADIGATVERETAESVASTTNPRDDRTTDDPATQIDAGSIHFVTRAKLTDHNSPIWALSFGPGGVLASCDQTSVRLWNLQSGKSTVVADNGDYPPRIAGCAVSPDGKSLAVGSTSDVAPLDFRNITAIGNRHEIMKVPLVPEDMRCSPDGRVFAAIVLRHGAMLWDGKTGQRLPDLEERYPAIMEIAFSPNGQYIATTGFNGVVLVNDVATGKIAAVLRPEERTNMHALAWPPGGKMIAASGKNPDIQLWNFETRKPIGRLKGHTDQVFDAQFAPATAPAPVLVTGGTDNVLRVWNPLTGQQIAALTGHNEMIRKIAFSPDGKAMASGDESGGHSPLGNPQIPLARLIPRQRSHRGLPSRRQRQLF